MSSELATIAFYTLSPALLTVTPGTDTLLVLTQGLRSGRGAAVACALDVNTGPVCWAAATVAGLTARLAAAPSAYRCVQVAGATYPLFLGVATLTRRRTTRAGILSTTAPSDTGARAALLLAMATIDLVLSLAWLIAVALASGRIARSLSGLITRHLERIGAHTLVGAGVAIAGSSL